ncbi:MAG: FAD/NAD(P)-binding protein, partial [Patescibacteria group bacterium]
SPARITFISRQTSRVKLFRLEFEQKIWGYNFKFKPGQFVELGIPGFGEAPFAPCNAPNDSYLELCVREAGRLTAKLSQMKVNDRVTLRGPYGNGWPLVANRQSPIANRNLLIIVGGLGLVPLRALLLGKNKFLGKNVKIRLFYGTKSPDEMLFRHEYRQWQKLAIEINLTIDQAKEGWRGRTGLVTTLLADLNLLPETSAFVCGPPAMYPGVIEKLKEKGLADEKIFLSLERRMHCGLGVCQHCAVGPYYTCQHGPVFDWKKLQSLPNAI